MTETCALHKQHRPLPLTLVTHHVQPRSMGGADAPANRIRVCDTGHRSVHVILAWLIFGGADPGGARAERAAARAGFRAWVLAGRPGNPHGAYAVHAPAQDATG